MVSKLTISGRSTKMESVRALVESASRMGKYKKDFSRIVIFTDLPESYMKKETTMRANSKTIVDMVKVAMYLRVVLITKVILPMTNTTVWGEK